MSKTYLNRLDSKIYGDRLIVHLREGVSNGSYFYRAKIEGQKGYIRRSCKTKNRERAMLNAEEAYDQLRLRAKSGYSLVELTVEKFYLDWLERNKNRFSEARLKYKRAYFERYFLGYFGKQNVSGLTKKFCDKYWQYRLGFWETDEGQGRIKLNKQRRDAKSISSHNVAKNPKYATLRAEATLINEMLQAASDDDQLSRSIKISAQDAIPKSQRGEGYRDTFTTHEYSVLTANLYNYSMCRGNFADIRVNKSHRIQRMMLRTFVLLASSTGLRVGELKQLCWGDLGTRKNDLGADVLVVGVRGETSKTGKSRAAVAHSPHIFAVLNELREVSKFTEEHDLIFYSEQQDGALRPVDLSASFKNFLRRCTYKDRPEGLRMSKKEKARSLYSLRHFYAVSRLKQGVSVFILSTNMGTSITQIKNHYAIHISGDAHIQELTKNKRKSGKLAKEEAVRKILEMMEIGIFDDETALGALRKMANPKL